MNAEDVFLLWHKHQRPGDQEDAKLIGVYKSREAAEGAKGRASRLPGFSSYQDGFHIDRYQLGQDHWGDGFVTGTEVHK